MRPSVPGRHARCAASSPGLTRERKNAAAIRAFGFVEHAFDVILDECAEPERGFNDRMDPPSKCRPPRTVVAGENLSYWLGRCTFWAERADSGWLTRPTLDLGRRCR